MKHASASPRLFGPGRSTWSVAAVVVALGRASSAQDFDWSSRFGSSAPDSEVKAVQAFDDPSGLGQMVYVAGTFKSIGGCRARGIARWDGRAWSALGEGIGGGLVSGGSPYAMEQFDGGSGAELVVGGTFQNAGTLSVSSIARWNGATWAHLRGSVGEGVLNQGSAGTVNDLQVFDDGSGALLWVTGSFVLAGGLTAKGVARWNGVDWSAAHAGTDGFGNAFAVFDDGSGPHLYLGGRLTPTGVTPALHVARWSGVTWEPVGAGLDNIVKELAVFDDGSGPRLYAGGDFTGKIASWDGLQWSIVGGGASASVEELEIFDDGNGPALIVGGSFATAGGTNAPRLARWDGSSWSAFGTVSSAPRALASVDFGPHGGRRLLVGGSHGTAGPVTGTEIAAPYLAQWAGAQWSSISASDGEGTDGRLFALEVHDDGNGPALYAGGEFDRAGAQSVSNIARWDGAAWLPLGGGVLGEVLALRSFDDGSGSALYVGGDFVTAGGVTSPGLARWNGVSWSTVVAGTNSGVVRALQIFDDGGGAALYAGGTFTNIGSTYATNIARWDGSAWTALDAGVPTNVHALAVFDDGSGPTLYAGGGTGGTYDGTGHLLRWSGSAWIAIGGFIDDYVLALRAFDDGSGAALFVGGEFLVAGGVTVDHLGKWNSSSWSAVLATPLQRRVRALAVFDEGQGAHLYLGGQSLSFHGAIGRIEGDQLAWLREPPPSGSVHALVEFDDGHSTRPALYAGGSFDEIGVFRAKNISRWAASESAPGSSYCTAGTTANGCQAAISSSGAPSRSLSSGFNISVAGVDGQKLGILFFGYAPTATHWGTGTSYVCITPPTTRAATQSSGGTVAACDGSFGLDFNQWMYANPYKAPAPGVDAFIQAWFRDPPSSKGTSLSNALQFELAP